MKLFIENIVLHPACIVGQDTDPTPAGYVESTPGSPVGNSHLEDWHNHAVRKIGFATNFMDWKCLRDIIRDLVYADTDSNLTGYDAFYNAAQKKIIGSYIPTKITDKLGFAQLMADMGGASEAFEALNNYLDKAACSREKRYIEVVDYVYRWLGKNQALQAEDDVRNNNLKAKYVERGVMYTSLDSVPGFVDWAKSTDDFLNNGLKKKIDDGIWAIGAGGPNSTDFSQKIADCVEHGTYPIT